MKKSSLVVVSVFVLAVVCGLLTVDSFSAEKEKGLVGWWKFDEGSGNAAKDSSGNGNEGEINNAEWAAGKSGKALKFNGEDAFVEVSHSEILAPDQFTVEAWINPERFVSSDQWKFGPIILSKYAGNWKGFVLQLQDNTGNPTLMISTPEVWVRAASLAPVKTGKWSHIAGTYDGKTAKIYADGVLAGSAEAELTHDEGISLIIGKGSWFDGAYFTGVIDEVKMYSRALSADEIKAHAEAK